MSVGVIGVKGGQPPLAPLASDATIDGVETTNEELLPATVVIGLLDGMVVGVMLPIQLAAITAAISDDWYSG